MKKEWLATMLAKMILGVIAIAFIAAVIALSMMALRNDVVTWIIKTYPDLVLPNWLLATGWFPHPEPNVIPQGYLPRVLQDPPALVFFGVTLGGWVWWIVRCYRESAKMATPRP
jgi:hypothetical protein